MSTSTDYWNVASAVQEQLNDIATDGNKMYECLESNDDAGEVADFLADIEKRLLKLTAQIRPNIAALRKVAKALDDVPGVKA